jgi:sugar lactone lactonase YvrE
VTVPVLTAKPLGITRCRLGEGPVWSPDRHELIFVDIDGQALHRYGWASGALRSRDFDRQVCAVTETASGGLLIAFDDRIVVEDGGIETTILRDALPPQVRFNDGGCDPYGRFFIGTTHRSFENGHGALFRLDGGRLTMVRSDLDGANGLAWTADGSKICHIDTPQRSLWISDYDVERGEPCGSSYTVDLSEHPGFPDGMAIDEEDCLWIAFYEGATVLRLDLDGSLLLRVEVPVPLVTSCTFVSEGLDQLAITTATPDRVTSGADGDLFHVEVGIRGRADIRHTRPRPWRDDERYGRREEGPRGCA